MSSSSSSSSSSPLKAFLVYGLVTGLKFAQLGAVDAHHREHKVHNIVLYPDKHSWCKTTTIKQVVNYPGCTSVEIDNNVCVGGCFSYSIPHMEPSDPSEVIVPYCDSCQPSETAWRQVTLKCDDDKNDPETPSHLVKHVQIIQNCSCTPCERNHYKSSSKDLFGAGSGVVEFGAGNYDDPANDLLLMQSHQHYVETAAAAPAGDQQQKEPEPEQEQERGRREGQELPPEADGKPDAVDSLQMRAKENASGAIPAAAPAASTIPSSNSTMASSEPPSISDETPPDSQDPATLQTTTTTATTTTTTTTPSPPPTTVTSRWKKMYALTYALIRKVQLNNTRHDREQLVDLLNLMKTTKPGIADFVEILRRDRPLEPHEIQHLNEILTRIEPAKFHKKHVAGAGVGVEKQQQQQQHNPHQQHQQRRHHHHHHQHLPEEARMEDVNDEHEKQTQEEEEEEEEEDGEDEVEHKDDEEMEVEKVEEVEEEQVPELEQDVDSDEIPAKVTTISDDQSPGAGGGGHHSSAEDEALPAAERQHQTVVEEEEEKEEAGVKATIDRSSDGATLVTLAGGGDEKDDKNSSSSSSHEIEPHHPHHPPHHTHPHPHHHHHHVNENIVPHGHLTRGPHGALVIEPDSSDRVHEKLDVNAHELKPNHAGTLLSYHSHSGESKKP